MPATKKTKRPGKSVQMYLPEDLMEAFDKHLHSLRPRPSMTSFFESMVEEVLIKVGKWSREEK